MTILPLPPCLTTVLENKERHINKERPMDMKKYQKQLELQAQQMFPSVKLPYSPILTKPSLNECQIMVTLLAAPESMEELGCEPTIH